MADEFFFAATLSEKNPTVKWDPEIKDEYPCNFKLIIRQALLGHDAKPDEYNVVEVETLSQATPIRVPIAVLKVGETRSVGMDLEFPDAPVVFKLTEGKGPVYLHGQHLPGTLLEEIEDYGDEMEEEQLEEEEADVDEYEAPKKKAKVQAQPATKAPAGKPTAVVAANNKPAGQRPNKKE